jgi:hypothetical protein
MKPQNLPMLVAGIVVAVACAGCEPGSSGVELASRSSELLYWSSILPRDLAMELIGRGLNGQALNGKDLDGRVVVAVSLEDVKAPKGGKNTLKLSGTRFPGVKDAIGYVFQGRLDDGDTLPLRIDAMTLAGEGTDVFARYSVSYPSEAGWVPLCGVDDDGAPVAAVPLEGRWDYRQGVAGGGAWIPDAHAFTFACEGYVLAKCVDLGYKPWAVGRICDTEAKGQPCVKATLRPFHQACTRALRADYCGDGTSHTHDGVTLSLYDGIGIRVDSEPLILEAEWTGAGARCVAALRADGDAPACLADLVDPACGDPERFEQGTLLMTEVEAGF